MFFKVCKGTDLFMVEKNKRKREKIGEIHKESSKEGCMKITYCLEISLDQLLPSERKKEFAF